MHPQRPRRRQNPIPDHSQLLEQRVRPQILVSHEAPDPPANQHSTSQHPFLQRFQPLPNNRFPGQSNL